MIFRKPKPPAITPDEALRAKPIRLTTDAPIPTDQGAKLTVTVRTRTLGRVLFRMPETVKKTYELDAVGLFVWEQIDGRTTVRQLIDRLRHKYKLNLREAEASTLQFLKMLMGRGLIGMPHNQPNEKGKDR